MKLFNKRIIFIDVAFICALLFVSYVARHYFFNIQHNNIQQIDSFFQASSVLSSADQNALVLFDVGDTLIVSASKMFWPNIKEQNKEWLTTITKTIFEKTKKSEAELMSIWRATEKPLLIEPAVIHIIKALQNRGIKVLALTAIMTGSDYVIPSLPKWRFETLKKIGIDFTKSGFPNMTFNELPEIQGEYPVLYKGIICTGKVPKGEVLKAFLKREKWKPSSIIFFDNDMEYLKSVSGSMSAYDVPFYGYQYLGANYMAGEIDKEIATEQLTHLVKYEKWISEDEARKLLDNEKKY